MSEPNEYPSPSFRMIAVIALLVGVGAGVFAFFSFVLPSLTDNGQTVYIQADKTPIKTPPDQPGGMEIPHQDKMVFNSVASPSAQQTPPERLAPPPEDPVYSNAAQSPAIQSGAGSAGKENLTAAPAPLSPGQTDAPGAQPAAQTAANMPSALGRAIQPANAPTAPAVQGIKPNEITTSFDPAKPDKAEKKKTAAAKAPEKPVVSESKSGPEPVEVEIAPKSEPAAKVAEATASPVVITPQQPVENEEPASNSGPLMATEEYQQEPANQKMATFAPGPKPTVPETTEPAGNVRFQLASFTDRESAEAAAQNFRSKYAGALGQSSLQVFSAMVKGKQVFRVQGSAASKEEVDSICAKVKATGGACVLAR